MNKGRTLLALGADNAKTDQLWMDDAVVSRIVRLPSAAPSGYRFGRRFLGLGLDSIAIVLKSRISGVRGPILASNPWVGMAARMCGYTDIAVTGLYALPGSRNFSFIRKVIPDARVVTMIPSEAIAWAQAGGQAQSVVYGNTFGYEVRTPRGPESEVRIFIGGSSDRDNDAIASLVEEAGKSQTVTSVKVVSDASPSSSSLGKSTVEYTGRVSASEFGRLLSESDVAFLPIKENGGRAAGHMVAVGATEAGIPVVSTRSASMDGYVDGRAIRYVDMAVSLHKQLVEVAMWGRQNRLLVRQIWSEEFSRRAYVRRVSEALRAMD